MRKWIPAAAVAIALLTVWPMTALAAEEEHDGGGPVQVDLWQAGFTIVVFLILVTILSRTAFKPILKGLQKREEFIHNSLEQAKKDREDAEARLKEYEGRLRAARDEASAIVAEGRRDAEETGRRVVEEARQAAQAEQARAVRDIQVARDTALKDLYMQSARLAMDVAGSVLKRELTPEDQTRLVEEALSQLRQQPSQSRN